MEVRMKSEIKKSENEDLRKKALKVLHSKSVKAISNYSETDILKLVHELEVHQIELELQNEELLYSKDLAEQAKDKYLELYDFAPSGYVTLSRKGIIQELNFAGAKILGSERSAFVGKRFQLFVAEESKLLFTDFIDQILAVDYKLSEEIVLIHQYGKPICTLISGISTEKKEQCLLTILDISERKAAEKEMRQIYRAVNQSPASVVITDLNGTIEFVNDKFCEITGYTFREVLGKNSRIIKSGMQEPAVYKKLWKTILSGNEWKGELLNKKKNGEMYWESVSISPILDDHDDVRQFVAIKEDVTEKQKMLGELVAAKDKAEESDRLKSAFLANMSHEIRTPMNGILGFAELLKEPDLSGDQQIEYLNIIEKSGARMLNIINNIVDISKIESGQMKIVPTKTNINEIIRELTTFFIPEAELKGIKIQEKNDYLNKNVFLTTDRNKLLAILTNLIKNSIKFTEKGIIEVGYRLIDASESPNKTRLNGDKMEIFPNEIEFFVKDSGIGIRKDMLDTIFERFRQESDLLTRNYEGAGLGLSISKAYVEMQGGKIWAESDKENGTNICFKLPDSVEPGESQEKELVFVPFHSKKLNILIAEDDESSRMLMQIKVKNICREPLIALNGKEVVKLAKENPDVDLILMDIKMPDLDGFEATRLIRQFNKKVIIIAITAFGFMEDKELALKSGCNNYLSKPILQAAFNKLIDSYF